jgi:hypothetical protein
MEHRDIPENGGKLEGVHEVWMHGAQFLRLAASKEAKDVLPDPTKSVRQIKQRHLLAHIAVYDRHAAL